MSKAFHTFQSTFPLQGTTLFPLPNTDMETHFNPRSHCRERLATGVSLQKPIIISIHVPIAGNDNLLHLQLIFQHNISIHVPIAGNDLANISPSYFYDTFQSTFPLQGTTPGVHAAVHVIRISIHVPIAGNDQIL